MITGIGVDTTEIARLQSAMAAKILTADEQQLYEERVGKRKAEFLAGRWAAKEAASKALGTGFGEQLFFTDIEVINDQYGRPHMRVKKHEARLIFHVSITHTDTHATAFVIAESKE